VFARLVTARNASILALVGAALWLAELPSIELDFIQMPHATQPPQLDIVSRTMPGIATLGLAAIAAATAIEAVVTRRRSVTLAAALMIAALSFSHLDIVLVTEIPQFMTTSMLVFATAWLVRGLADHSVAALVAAASLAIHGLGMLPGGPLDTAFAVQQLAPAGFGAGILAFVVGRSLARLERPPKVALAT
jgi:hypothetical protein